MRVVLDQTKTKIVYLLVLFIECTGVAYTRLLLLNIGKIRT
jgi:hypothetical protein